MTPAADPDPTTARGDGAVLALDATADRCAAALLTPDGALSRRIEPMARGHAERAPVLIEALLKEAGLAFDEIAVFAAVAGPGSFTGVRVGVALMRGYALATGARAVGLDGFLTIAAAACGNGLRAERALVVFGKPPRLLLRPIALTEQGAAPLGPMAAATPGDAAADPATLILGPGAAALDDAERRRHPGYEAIDIGVAARLAATSGPAIGAPAPLYARPPDATPSREPRPTRLGS